MKIIFHQETNSYSPAFKNGQALVQLPPGHRTLSLQETTNQPTSYHHVWFPYTILLINYFKTPSTLIRNQTFTFISPTPISSPNQPISILSIGNTIGGNVCFGTNTKTHFNSLQQLIHETTTEFFHSTFTENYTHLPLPSGQIIQTFQQWHHHSKKTPLPINFNQLQSITLFQNQNTPQSQGEP